MFELVTLKSGVKSLRATANREVFHPVIGPEVEAKLLHVEQQNLLARCAESPNFVIWDVGLGAAANVLAAIETLRTSDSDIEIHSFDRTTAPLEFALTHARELGYLEVHQEVLGRLLVERDVAVRPRIRWQLHLGEFGRQLEENQSLPTPNAIFYDPYSPLTNPEMWALEHFRLLQQRLKADIPCLLTNYTRSTAVRVTLLLAGFYVGRGCSLGEKGETTVASNRLELLLKPLDRRWLETVRISGNAAPLSMVPQPQQSITATSLQQLELCEQFHPR